ncbi:hypothetical protein T03_2282 [Trichinella britovi]|uniref:Uncharacterized protein n=1 Tax=Trichinella britovi TaxID=45882 RepID=A0A0V0ZIT1_TRIBR|nr:hypothetical protein T03_2282 [Trichinella britovi]
MFLNLNKKNMLRKIYVGLLLTFLTTKLVVFSLNHV